MAASRGGGNQSGFGVRNNAHGDLGSRFCRSRAALARWCIQHGATAQELFSCATAKYSALPQYRKIQRRAAMFIPSESENVKLI